MLSLVLSCPALHIGAATLPRAPVLRAPQLRMEVAEPAAAEVVEAAPAVAAKPWTYEPVGKPMDVSKWTTDPELTLPIRRAEFWSNETATILEIINILGRWNSHLDFKDRSIFTPERYKEENLEQAATEKRHRMALKLKCTERVAMQQNLPNKPFTNEKLAASVGMTCAQFNEIPVTNDACNVVYDALAESRSGLIPYDVADQRRNEWLNEDGSLNDVRFKIGLAKSRFLVIVAWFVFGKGNFVWVLVTAQALHDIRPDLFPTPKDLNLDKIGFFV